MKVFLHPRLTGHARSADAFNGAKRKRETSKISASSLIASTKSLLLLMLMKVYAYYAYTPFTFTTTSSYLNMLDLLCKTIVSGGFRELRAPVFKAFLLALPRAPLPKSILRRPSLQNREGFWSPLFLGKHAPPLNVRATLGH
jgi:hypothetical protein